MSNDLTAELYFNKFQDLLDEAEEKLSNEEYDSVLNLISEEVEG